MSACRKPGLIGFDIKSYQSNLDFNYDFEPYKKLQFHTDLETYDCRYGKEKTNLSRNTSFEPHILGTKQDKGATSQTSNSIAKFFIEESIKALADDAIKGSKWILKFDTDILVATAKIKQGKQTIKQLATSVAGYTDEAAMLRKYIPGSSNKVADITRKIQELKTKISIKKTTLINNKQIVSKKLSFMNKAGKVLDAGGAALWGYQAITEAIELNEKIRDDEAEVTDYCEMALVLLQAPLPAFGLGAPIAAVGLIVLEEQKKMLNASQKAIESMYGFLDQVFKIILNIKSGKLITAAIKSRAKTINSRTPYAEHERILFDVSESIRQLIATTVHSLSSTRTQIAKHDWMEREVLYSENRDDWNNKINSYSNTLIQLQQDRKARCTAYYILYCSYFLNQELVAHLATIRATNNNFIANQNSYKRRNDLLEEKRLSLQS